MQKAMNMKIFLCAFEQLLDLKIHLHWNQFFFNYEQAKIVEEQYTHMFGCDVT